MKYLFILISLVYAVFTQDKNLQSQTIKNGDLSITMTKELILMKKGENQLFNISLSNIKYIKDKNETIISEPTDKIDLYLKRSDW
jgi:hypothetical protein